MEQFLKWFRTLSSFFVAEAPLGGVTACHLIQRQTEAERRPLCHQVSKDWRCNTARLLIHLPYKEGRSKIDIMVENKHFSP